MKKSKNVADYIAAQPEPQRALLRSLRRAIREAAPRAEECISYNIPAYKSDGMLLWFAAFKGHIGLYPKVSAMKHFKTELGGYRTSKGAIQFPLDKPLPIGLIKRIVRFRLKENSASAK